MIDKIIDLLHRRNKALSIYDIKKELGLDSAEELQDLLHNLDLLEKGFKIYHTNKDKYMLFNNSHLRIGKIITNKKGFGFVDVLDEDDVYVAFKNLNGAINGDKVIVEITSPKGLRKEGRVLRVIERNSNALVGTIKIINNKTSVILDDDKVTYGVRLTKESTKDVVDGHKVLIKLLNQINSYTYSGEVIKIIGHINDPGIDILSICAKHEINDTFSDEVLIQLEQIPNEVSKEELSNRTDLRKEMIFTIDGDDTKDIDDAISIKKLSNGNSIGYYEPIVFGDSITDNGDGTYTLNNPQSITLTDWVNNYANYYRKYTCNGSSTTCEHPRLIVNANPSNYGYIDAAEKIVIAKRRNGLVLEDTKLVNKEEWISNYNSYSDYKYTCNNTSTTCTESNLRIIDSYNALGYKYAENHYYGSSVTWDGTKYTLVNPIGLENYKNLDTLSTHHYTCVDAGRTTCTRVAYIHHYSSGTKYYLLLENGETSVSSKLDDMLKKNSTSSTIKNSIDAWYKRNLLEYDNYIDDTIYCNNRNILNLNGWNPNGGVLNESFQFNGYASTTDLNCTQVTDQFSVSNPSAQLKYKIGLPTFSEMNLLNNSVIRKSGVWYWLGSPCCFDYRSCIRSVNPDGDITDRSTVSKIGIRPTITLKSKTLYSSGDGSMADPYVVDTN